MKISGEDTRQDKMRKKYSAYSYLFVLVIMAHLFMTRTGIE